MAAPCLLCLEVSEPSRPEPAAFLASVDEGIRTLGGYPLSSKGGLRVVRFDAGEAAARCALDARSRAAEVNRCAATELVRLRVSGHAASSPRFAPADMDLGLRLLESVPPGRVYITRAARACWQAAPGCAFLPLGPARLKGASAPEDVLEAFPLPSSEK